MQDGSGKHGDWGKWLAHHLGELREHEDIKHLPVDQVIKNVNDIAGEIRSQLQVVGDLGVGSSFKSAKEEGIRLTKRFEDVWKEVMDYADQFNVTLGKVASLKVQAATKHKNDKNKYLERCTTLRIPLAYGNALATMLCAWIPDTRSKGCVECCPFEIECSISPTATSEEFIVAMDVPMSFTTPTATDKSFGLAKQLQVQYNAVHDAVPQKVQEMMRSIQLTEGSFLGHSSLQVPQGFDWNAVPPSKLFVLQGDDLKSVPICALLPNQFQWCRESWPYVGMSGTLTCLQGCLSVIIISPVHLRSLGAGDMTLWLKMQNGAEFGKVAQVLLVEGQSVFWPFGYCPIVFGVAGGNDLEPHLLADRRASSRKLPNSFKMSTPCAYSVHLNLDMQHAKEHDPSLLNVVYLNMLACQQHVPKNVAKWNRYKQYRDSLKCDREESPAAEPTHEETANNQEG